MKNKSRSFFLFLITLALFSSCSKKHAGGLLFDEERYNSLPRKAQLVSRSYENLPSSVSLVYYTPYPGDQGSFSTCAAWATSYAGMTTVDALIHENTDRNYTTQNVFSPYYLYQMCNPYDVYGEDGMYMEVALDFLKNTGVPLRSEREEMLVDNFGYFDAASEYSSSRLYKIGDDATLFSTDASSEQKILSVKKSLSQNKPVVISFLACNSFSYAREYWEPNFYESPANGGGHAMLVVAYDDDKRGGSFCIQNSWGRQWGKDGYVWVRYNDFAEYTRGAYELSRAIIGRSRTYEEPSEIEPITPPYFEEPEPVKPPVQKKVLVYEGSFELPIRYEKEVMQLSFKDGVYKTTRPYDSYTRFQLYMTNTKPCYVYALASDEATGKANVIFPLEGTSPLLDYSENTVAYPAEDKFIMLDDVKGTDYFVVLYSSEELDIKDIASTYEKSVTEGFSGKENFYRRIQAAVGSDRLVDPLMTDFSEDRVSFKAYSLEPQEEKILPILIQIEHD